MPVLDGNKDEALAQAKTVEPLSVLFSDWVFSDQVFFFFSLYFLPGYYFPSYYTNSILYTVLNYILYIWY